MKSDAHTKPQTYSNKKKQKIRKHYPNIRLAVELPAYTGSLVTYHA